MLFEHRLDPRRGGATFESRQNMSSVDEHERRHRPNLELRDEIRPFVDVDRGDSEPLALLAREMGDQTLHSAGWSRLV